MKNYVLNKETQKIELHFSKEEYKALVEEEKKEIKSAYLYSGKAGAWVSRSTNNHYSALKVAEKLGFTDGGSTGERLSYEEELSRKTEKAEARAERYEQYATNAVTKGKQLQSGLDAMHGDIAFFTQPNINSSRGRSFTNYREKLFDRYERGFEEYRKSEYFRDKAQTAEETANMDQLKDRSYLSNRIKECEKAIKKYESYIVRAEGKQQSGDTGAAERIEKYLKEIEYQGDKMAFMQNRLDQVGTVYTKENIKEGYSVKIRGTWYLVIKANRTTVEGKVISGGAAGMVLKYNYAEIQEMKIPEGYREENEEIKNPYKENDILVCYSVSGNRVIKAYQVIKTTAKGVQLQSIKIADNKPVKDSFTVDKAIRRQIVKSKYSDFAGCYDGNWQLSKYTA